MLSVQMCGALEVASDGQVLPDSLIGGRQGRLVFAYLVCERHRPVSRDELANLLWPDRLPDSWSSSLSAVVSRLRRLLAEAGLHGPSALVSTARSYQLVLPAGTAVDLEELVAAVELAEAALDAGDTDGAIQHATRAETIAAKGFLPDECEWVDRQRSSVRSLAVRAALVRSGAHELTGAHRRAIDAAHDALHLDDTHEATYRQLMRALDAAGERGEALRVWERCRTSLIESLGADPSTETEALYLQILGNREPVRPADALPSGVVTFLLTDIVESTALWDRSPAKMAAALERHDRIVAEVIAAHGGTLLKSKLEGDATVSVFSRATTCASAALGLVDAIAAEPWPESTAPRLRMAMHTGEAFEREGDYFGPALNRAARLRSLAGAGQVLLSQAVAELVRDHLPDDVALHDLGHHELRGLSRGENVFQLARSSEPDLRTAADIDDAQPLVPPALPAALVVHGPFVGRVEELAQLQELWLEALTGNGRAAFVGGEPGVGKTRLAAELAAAAHRGHALVLYGRCDEDLAAPLHPFVEALRALVPALGADRLRAVRGAGELARVVPEIADLLPASHEAPSVDPDSERIVLFDAVTQLLRAASDGAPVLLVLDDLHWAGKTTLSLLRHVLRGARTTRMLVVGTYRDTELGRSHPLAGTLADLRRDGFADRVSIGGLGTADVVAYLAAIGNENRALGHELAEVTSGNPFFLIEVLRHIEETGGAWEPGSLPEGVREATGRRLSRLSDRANDALSVAAVVGASFDLRLVEQINGAELTDEIAEASRAGLVVEEGGAPGRFRFAHALVRQVLLAELVSLKRVRLHRAIAELLEATPRAAERDTRLADLAYHWFECAAAGGAANAVDACRRAADQAMERLAYEEAADLYGMALQAVDGVDDPDHEVTAALHLARCDALLTAGDVSGARAAIDALEHTARGSERLTAWYATYEGLLAVLAEPDRLTEIVQSIGAAATAMRAIGDLDGEAKAHYVHASALERLGQIGAAERALDAALAAARASGDRRLADAVLAEAPPAALWGPRPVTRASGSCLDVIRVLRITQGAPAVEAVALRCQAVLEALRGRIDAARRMIGSARRTVERLGLTHRQLEAEVAAGFIELLDGDAAAAEALLRHAYGELRDRGLGGEAAQAGAFLGRALLMQGRDDEADAVALEAAELAGADLKAAIAWRDVRAEAAARRGDLELARSLAEEAVELATATDALLLVADARLTLATVLRAAGDPIAADAEAGRAVEAVEAKGATAMLARVRGAVRHVPPVARAHQTTEHVQRPPSTEVALGQGRIAMAAIRREYEAANRRDFAAMAANHTPGRHVEDRRRVVGMPLADGANTDELRFPLSSNAELAPPELVEARGERTALVRGMLHSPDFEVPYLVSVRSDAQGRLAESVILDEDDLDAARAVLDEVAARAVDERFENDASQSQRRWHDAFNNGDVDAVRGFTSDDFVYEDRRPFLRGTFGYDASLRNNRIVLEGGGRFEMEVIATRGRTLALLRLRLHIAEHDPGWLEDRGDHGDTESELLIVYRLDERGRGVSSVGFDPDDVAEAVAELDRAFAAHEAAHRAAVLAALCADAAARRAFVAHVPRLSATAGLWVLRCDDAEPDLWVEVFTHDGRRPTAFERFTVEEFDEALVRFEDLASAIERVTPHQWSNEAWVAARSLHDAVRAGDLERLRAVVSTDVEAIERRLGVRLHHRGEAFIDTYRRTFDLADLAYQSELIATRGEHVALTRDRLSFVDGDAGRSEVEILSIIVCDADGHVHRTVAFEPEALRDAFAELDELFVSAGGLDTRAFCDAFDARDWAGCAGAFDPGCAFIDERFDGFGRLDREGFIAWLRGLVNAVPDAKLWLDHVLADDRGSLAMARVVGRRDGEPFERSVAAVASVDHGGRVAAMRVFDGDAVDRASEAYAERRQPPPPEQFANLAWQTAIRVSDALNRRDMGTARAWQPLDIEFFDRRAAGPTNNLGYCNIDVFAPLIALDDFSWQREMIATRGEHLVLVCDRVAFVPRHGAGLADVESLAVVEVDAAGVVVSNVAFDPDRLTDAFDELDRRYVAQGGTDLYQRLREAHAARDWERLASHYAPTCVFEDHRPLGWARYLSVSGGRDVEPPRGLGRMDVAAFVDTWRAVHELAPDERVLIDHVLAHDDRASLVIGRSSGTFDGGAFEWPSVVLNVFDAEGRICQLRQYALEDLGRAREQFDRLSVPGSNAAWRGELAIADAVNARDSSAFESVLTPDYVHDDRRTFGVGTTAEKDYMRLLLVLDRIVYEPTLLASRGDRLALARVLVRFHDGDAGPAEVETLQIKEVDADGNVSRNICFLADELDAALAELDARFTLTS